MKECELFRFKDNFKTEEKDMVVNEKQSESYCNFCKDDTINNIKGELICVLCSRTYGNIIDNTAEWRYYGSEDSKNSDPNRCGMPTNSLLPEFSLGSVLLGQMNLGK